MKLDHSKLSLTVGDNFTLTAVGNVTAIAEGVATITVTTVDGGKTDRCLDSIAAGNITVAIPDSPIPVSNTFAGTDDLGRVLPGNSEVGNLKPDKQVGIFYFLWLGVESVSQNYWDLTEIVAAHPEVLDNFNHPNWGTGRYYYWGRPIYEYYHSDDSWVALRNIQLLTDAMIDFLVIDATNAKVYERQADVLMRAMNTVRSQGKNPPKIVFYTNTYAGSTMQKVYDNFYKPGAPYSHPDCWYYLDGKPLIIGISSEAKGNNYENFFTFRESQWPTESQKVNGWPWISFTRPQRVHYNRRGEPEIINVSIAQHPNPTAGMGGSAFYGNRDNWGRSYHNGAHGNPDVDIPYGYNFQEQWDYALAQNVPFVYVTGWNEWIAGRWASMDNNPQHSWFCDCASPEYSRDAEPSFTAGMKDNYYMQLVANIRRFKGVEPFPYAGPVVTIHEMNDWPAVSPEYRDYTGDTNPRNSRGGPPATQYVNTTGRNDFRILKIARDEQNVYFYAETVNDITPCTGDNWMRLYINSDRNFQTGWHGYDYRVIEGKTLQRYDKNSWNNVSNVNSRVEKNKMMITIPRTEIGLFPSAINMEFKWSDNMQSDDPLDWYINGDAAPGGRFNYVYIAKE